MSTTALLIFVSAFVFGGFFAIETQEAPYAGRLAQVTMAFSKLILTLVAAYLFWIVLVIV